MVKLHSGLCKSVLAYSISLARCSQNSHEQTPSVLPAVARTFPPKVHTFTEVELQRQLCHWRSSRRHTGCSRKALSSIEDLASMALVALPVISKKAT